jgi:hypothetical protein
MKEGFISNVKSRSKGARPQNARNGGLRECRVTLGPHLEIFRQRRPRRIADAKTTLDPSA